MRVTDQTNISPLQVRQQKAVFATDTGNSVPDWQNIPNIPPKRSLLKNTAVASALVLCAVTLRTGTIPSLSNAADAIITAAADQSLLDEQLGKLSFVSALFPEAVLVFGESHTSNLAIPVSGGVVIHAWSENEPYMTFRSVTNQVISADDGEVIGIYHGNADERLVQIINKEGLACLYGNMEDVNVQIGEVVSTGSVLGTLLPGEDLAFEVRQNGISINPAGFFSR